MLHSSIKQSIRTTDSSRLGKANGMLCADYFKGNEWYEVPGAGGEVGVRR